MDPMFLAPTVVSFIVTVIVFIFFVRQSKPSFRIFWMIACTIGAVVWLGLLKGAVASIIALAITTGYVGTVLDARKVGAKVANSLGIEKNLFFTCLEQSLPMYLHVLARLHRDGQSIEEVRNAVVPYVAGGLDVLEGRFGPQSDIDAARKRLHPILLEIAEREGIQ